MFGLIEFDPMPGWGIAADIATWHWHGGRFPRWGACSFRLLGRGVVEDEVFYRIVHWALAGTLVGARLAYAVNHSGDYFDNPLSVFAVWEGGLVGRRSQENPCGNPIELFQPADSRDVPTETNHAIPGAACRGRPTPSGSTLTAWGRIGCLGFGGPPTHITLVRQLGVTRSYRWSGRSSRGV